MTDIDRISSELDRDLPAIARRVIQQYLEPADPGTQAFLREPDGREHHQTEWHRWGIITHTRVFLRQFDHDIPQLLRDWSLWREVHRVLSRKVDGVRRWDLLRVSIVLHDIGKFGARRHSNGKYHFSGHESLSGEIIREQLDLARYGLTAAQIEYIAHTAEDHFVLGRVRREARQAGWYDEMFVASEQFGRIAKQISCEHPLDFVEIGVMFLGDSLAKIEPGHGPQRAAGQHPVNMAVARRYLEIVLSTK